MNNDVKKIYNDNFNFNFKAAVYNNIKIATNAYALFLKENEDFFSFDKKSTLLGHLLTYVVEKQFSDSSFSAKAPYSVSLEVVNRCKHKALFLESNNFKLTIGRTLKSNKLPCSSKYKLQLAKENYSFEDQIQLQTNNQLSVFTEKKYAIITYNYYMNNLTHLNIVIPTEDYKDIYYKESLLNNVETYNNYIPKEIEEETVARLKNSLNIKANKIV